jgi:hypothetical protein
VPFFVAQTPSSRLNGAGGIFMRYLWLAVCVSFACGLGTSSSAQQKESAATRLTKQYLASRVGTVSAITRPRFSDGKLNGCAVEFSALLQDWAYSKGAFVKLDGSFGVMSANSNIAATLKVVVHDINPSNMQLTPSPPASAYLVAGAKTSMPFFFRRFESDTPGGLFSIFKLDGTFEIISSGLIAETVTVAFNRRPGGVDIAVPIDLTVEDTDANGKIKRSHQVGPTFFECAKELANSSISAHSGSANTLQGHPE